MEKRTCDTRHFRCEYNRWRSEYLTSLPRASVTKVIAAITGPWLSGRQAEHLGLALCHDYCRCCHSGEKENLSDLKSVDVKVLFMFLNIFQWFMFKYATTDHPI